MLIHEFLILGVAINFVKGMFVVSNYISKIQTISHHITTISEPIFERGLFMYALASLSCNPNYIPLITSINMMSDKPNFSSFYN